MVMWNIITYSYKCNYVNSIHTRMFIHLALKFYFEKLKILVFLISQLCGIEGIEEKNSDAFTSSKYADL